MTTPLRRLSVLATASALLLAGAPGVANAANLDGTSGDDTINGTSRADNIQGFRGADTLHGREGADHLDGGLGADRVSGGPGNDVVIGGGGMDELLGNDGADALRARDATADRVNCGAGSDTAYVDSLDLFPTSELGKPQGNCEKIVWNKPWVLPVRLSDMYEGAAGLDDPHHDYPASDLQAPSGSPIQAIRGGFVEDAGDSPLGQGWCGKGVVIRGVGGGQYMYCHMRSVAVSKGQGIGSGRKIGTMGSTGNSTGPHLHLQIWKHSFAVNGFYNSVCPQPMLKAIHNDRPVPRPADLPSSGCSY